MTASSIGRNASYNLGAALIPLLLSLVTVPLYLQLIGPDRYGVLAIAWLLLGYFGLFDLGLGRATSYRIAALRDAPSEQRATTLWSALAVNLGMGAVGALLLWIAADWFFTHVFKVDPRIRPEMVAGVPFLALAVPVATLTGVLTGALQGREQFLRANSVSVTSTILFQLFPLTVAWLWGPDLPRLLVAALAARLLAVAALWYLCHAELTRGHKLRVERQRLGELLRFGGWVSVTSFLAPMLVAADRFLIGGTLGAVAVTIYSVPFQLAQRIGIVPGALSNALFPRLSSAQPDEQRRLGSLAFRTIAALMTAPVMAGIFAIGPFLELWVGPEIGGQSAPIGRLLLIGFWLNAFALVPFTRLQASGRPDLVTFVLLVQVPFYLAGLWWAMKLWGLTGCAVMFVLRCLTDYLLLSWALERRVAGFGLILVNLGLLFAAAALPLWAAQFTLPWFVASLFLLFAAAALGLWSLPADMRDKVGGLLGAGWRSRRA